MTSTAPAPAAPGTIVRADQVTTGMRIMFHGRPATIVHRGDTPNADVYYFDVHYDDIADCGVDYGDGDFRRIKPRFVRWLDEFEVIA